MQLKRRVMDPRAKDEISDALAFEEKTDPDANGVRSSYTVVPGYIYNHYPKGLRERCLGPHTKDLVGVTRFYPRCDPKVVIDFEPPHPDPWFREEKLQFFLEQGIAYVPIYLNDTLTTEAFKERVEAARRMARSGHQESMELKALAKAAREELQPGVEDWLNDPALMASLDAEAGALLAKEFEARGRPWFGVAKTRRLQTIKTQLIQKLREDLKRGRLVDPFDRHRQPASTAQ